MAKKANKSEKFLFIRIERYRAYILIDHLNSILRLSVRERPRSARRLDYLHTLLRSEVSSIAVSSIHPRVRDPCCTHTAPHE